MDRKTENLYTPLWSDETAFRASKQLRRLRFYVIGLSLYGILASLMLFVLASRTLRLSSDQHSPSLLKPFNDYVRYMIKEPNDDSWNPDTFAGSPSPELEQAWNKLIHGTRGKAHSFTINQQEAQDLGITEGLTSSAGDFEVITGVHHNLHCLRRLRQEMFSEHYFPNATAERLADNRHHTLHCIESLRTSLVCNPDLTIHPYRLIDSPWHPYVASSATRKQCVDWDLINQFMDVRANHEKGPLKETVL